MAQASPQYQNIYSWVESILKLVQQEKSLLKINTNTVRTSLNKAIAPKFEIVFAGAFSAGKSMLINALLGRELLYSAEGHATGTECRIEYAEADKEKVVLTFLSEDEVQEQVDFICKQIGLKNTSSIEELEVIDLLQQGCTAIIEKEGGESKSEKAKQAKALILLLEGYVANYEHLHTDENAMYSMEHFNFTNLQEAAGYARRGSNSAVLKRIEYYCHHPLLKDGNVIIDTPGIDAPVAKDAELTYEKIQNPTTSAVVCVLKAAATGELTEEETELLETIRENPGIRDRVFYVFNRIDETWFNAQLRQRLENLISSQFNNSDRVYQTSGLLGFYGSQIKKTSVKDRFGLDSIFTESVKGLNGQEETPQFVYAFNNYCANSGKLSQTPFRISVNGYETPNDNYTRILNECGQPLIQQLIQDSGIEEFKTAITRYLTEEKRPQLFQNLKDDLEAVCIQLKKCYQDRKRELDSQPQEVEAMKSQELQKLSLQLQQIGNDFCQHLSHEVNNIINNSSPEFESDFHNLQARMIHRLDELLETFSVAEAYRQATLSHPRNATAPLLAILVEAFYYLSNQLEDILVESSQQVVSSLFSQLYRLIRQADYYRNLYRLLGEDAGIESKLKQIEELVRKTIINAAKIECDRFVRESPLFYDEGTFSIYQFREILQQTSQGYDSKSMVEAEPAIRQLLKLDFEEKVSDTIRKNFRQIINQTLKTQLLPMGTEQADIILQQYPQARIHLEKTLEKEALAKIQNNQKFTMELAENTYAYNHSATNINQYLQAMGLNQPPLPMMNMVFDNINLNAIDSLEKTISNGTYEETQDIDRLLDMV